MVQLAPQNLDNLVRVTKFATLIGDQLYDDEQNRNTAIHYYKNGIEAFNSLGTYRKLNQDEFISYSHFHKMLGYIHYLRREDAQAIACFKTFLEATRLIQFREEEKEYYFSEISKVQDILQSLGER